MLSNLCSRKPRLVFLLCSPLMHLVVLGMNGCAASDPPQAPPLAYAEGFPAEPLTQWPVALESNEGRVEVYQPQPESMTGDVLTARAAVSLTRAGAAAPAFGAAWFTAHITTDRDTRTVTIHDVTVKDVRLPAATAAEQQEFARAIGGRLSAAEVTFPLDQLTASLDTAHREQIEAAHLKTDPPRILFSTTPATLISVNGPPKLQPMEQPAVSRVANTPFILLLDDVGRRYYLKAGSRWVSAPDLSGPWVDTANVPLAIAAAAAELATPATQPSVPAGTPPAGASVAYAPTTSTPIAPIAAELAPAAADARIIVATEPTELIVATGNPQFTPLPGGAGGELLYASNTESDLFLDQADQRYYVLLSGRWYAAGSLQGPWIYVASDRLPPAFGQIPPDSPRADVLPFVAGTAEAHEAVLDASIPQTASIRRDAGAKLSVAYDGEPRFQDIPECPGVSYAINTPEDVLHVNGWYYCCHQGVWYESQTPNGTWVVCVKVPQVLYTLPPSCPAYHVVYCNVYDYYPDYVTCGYLPGYTGTFVDGPTIVYGTGYNYPGWYGTTYFPPPCTWGYAAYYDPFACAWGFDLGLYWGTGWFGYPWHDRWWHDHPGEQWGWHRWWGPGGFVHSHDIRGHLADARSGGAFRADGRNADLAARLPGTGNRGPGWNNLYARGGNVARNFTTAQLRQNTQARAITGARDNVFAGSDGRVFRSSNSGWEERGGSGWSGVDRVPDARPTYRPAQGVNRYSSSFARPEAGLDRDFAARNRSTLRSAAVNSFGGGGFRGGGGFHGGGGRR